MEDRRSIVPMPITEGMKEAYVDYAMSVIIARALPDVRDGFKPVHRRIIYTMFEEHITPDKKFRKSASAVGNVLARYHPHGDASVYDAMVRLAQPFNMRYPLIWPQGNFGSVDGDSAAHMRYTEAKLARISMEMIRDLGKDTVDWQPNFDNSSKEPKVLPALLPNLLINGAEGIAVGMASKIPPHNLREVIDGTLAYLENEDISTDELMQFIPGPDFPTGAVIEGRRGIKDAYETGRGCICMRSVTSVEEVRAGKTAIIVTEIPFQVNKAKLVEEIADKVNSGLIKGITDLRDESSRKGIRIVIELSANANIKVVLNNLWKYTRLQTNYNAIMLALVDGVPRELCLKDILKHYIEHRRQVTARRTAYELQKAKDRDLIVQAVLKSLEHIDEIIEIIEKSADADSARAALMNAYGFIEMQAQAVLDMRLQRLTGLEYEKYAFEHKNLSESIEYYESLLKDSVKLDGVIREELIKVRDRFSDARRTQIKDSEAENLNIEDLIKNDRFAVTITRSGYAKRVSIDEYRVQGRGGRGRRSLALGESDTLLSLFTCRAKDTLLFLTSSSRVYKLKAYELPSNKRASKGMALVNLLKLEGGERVVAVLCLERGTEEGSLVTLSSAGVIKRTSLSEFMNINSNGKKALGLKDGDELLAALYSAWDTPKSGNESESEESENEDADAMSLFLATANGQILRFTESSVRSMGRMAAGVKSLNLRENDAVCGFASETHGSGLLLITENGYGKYISSEQFKIKGRGGMGVRGMDVTEKSGSVIAAMAVNSDAEAVVSTKNGICIRFKVDSIRPSRRGSGGVCVIKLSDDDKVIGAAPVIEKDSEDIVLGEDLEVLSRASEEIYEESADESEAENTAESYEGFYENIPEFDSEEN